MRTTVRASAPGRVNLIGDHTDYTGGLVLPMAIDRETVVQGRRGGERVRVRSEQEPGWADVPLDAPGPEASAPAWAGYVAGVVRVVRPRQGFTGTVRSTVPVGAGLSSSAALEVAMALALGFDGTALELARACQRAEQLTTGVPCGIMDQLAAVAGVEGHALLIDCHSCAVTPIPLGDAHVVVAHSGEERALAGTAYAERRAECEAAAAVIGPLRLAGPADVEHINDPMLRRRARHVTTENRRVEAFARALEAGEHAAAGALMDESHRSLRDDFEVSTAALDALVDRLRSAPGVHGARLTGAGFGGCAVALVEPGAAVEGWRVRAVNGATVA